jgi:hypothetical protein
MEETMRFVFTAFLFAACARPGMAQDGIKVERLPADIAVAAARQFLSDLDDVTKQLGGAPLLVPGDADKVFGLCDPDTRGAVLVIPARTRKRAEADKADGEPVGYLMVAPVGVRVTPVVRDKPHVGGKRLLLTYPDKGEDREVEVLRLRRKAEGDGPGKLLVYTMDKDPILSVPLREEGKGDLPVELSFRVVGKDRVAVTVILDGKWSAEVQFERLP